MTVTQNFYTRSELSEGFQKAGLRQGDIAFVHVCLETLGQPQGCDTSEQVCELLLGMLREAVGSAGTILVPTYTFSFCRQETFEVQSTPTAGGPWSASKDFLEYFRRQPGVIRSRDPIHSVAGLGPQAAQLLTDLPNTCFGPGSVFDRFKQAGGKICMIGVELGEATFRHYVEEVVGVPFRFKKLFTGVIREDDRCYKTGWIYNVRILSDNGFPEGGRLEQIARASGQCRVAHVGGGEILGIEAQTYDELIRQELAKDPWCTAKGPADDPVKLEQARVDGPGYSINLPQNASLTQMIGALWHLPRDIVSEAYDASLKALATQVPMTVHEYPTGTECWSWIVPEKWTCYEAYLETLSGQRLFAYADNPLHVVSYSLPFEGEVSRETLFDHLHVHPQLAEAIPFIFKYYERDWGLCCSQKLKDSLTDDRYRVVIKTDFSYGTLKVGEVVASGSSDECIVLCAHLCHPAMVNDDLTGVVVGIEAMRTLLQRRNLRYTYRFLIVPETIGSVAYLSQNEALIPKMKGGLFLEMLGLDNPPALQRSFADNTEVDQCFTLALKTHDPASWTGAFRTIIGNDERQFNAPGVRAPMLSLSRVLPPSAPEWPYREYHSSWDSPETVSLRRLDDAVKLVLRMIDTLEQNLVPVNKFKGEVFCSRYGLHIDAYTNPEGNRALFDIMFLIDGTRSIVEIANICGISVEATKEVVGELRRYGLVEYNS